MKRARSIAFAGAALIASPLAAQDATADPDLGALRAQIAAERNALDAQQQALDAQRARLGRLEDQMLARMRGTGTQEVAANSPQEVSLPASPPPAGGQGQTVGQAPTDQRQVQVAVLADQGGILSRAGRLTLESDLEYARSDRNRVLFRGVAIPEAVLIGAFDINESRQDIVTAAAVARLGLSGRLEVNARLPYVYRWDNSAIAPVVNNGNGADTGTDRAAKGGALGDVEFGARYQFTNGHNGWPFLIAGVQVVAPTGTDPFAVPRDGLGNPLRAATGAGFWGITPNLTALLPSDPAVLFASIGYTYNFARRVDRQIGAAIVDRVAPGGEPAATVGMAVSLNPRTSFSLGYAHTVALGTRTTLQTIDGQSGAIGSPERIRTRSLQLGRLLFGVSYRTSPRTTINWNIEAGVTEDATDLRTTLRVPLTLDLFR